MKKTRKRFYDLMDKYGLSGKFWSHGFNQKKTIAGVCNITKRYISISEPIVLLNEEENFEIIEDIMLHEIAHALAFENYGEVRDHGKEWRDIAISIGCSGSSSYNENQLKVPNRKYKYECPNCGLIYERHRRITEISPVCCSECCDKYNNGKYSKKYNFIPVNM